MRNVYQAIASVLKTVADKKIYIEDVPQGFKMPAWLINIYGYAPLKGINTRRHTTLNVDVSYIPDDKSVNRAEECIAIGESLGRIDMAGDYHLYGRSLNVTDNVLHFTFNINYVEIPVITETKMQEMNQNLKTSEE